MLMDQPDFPKLLHKFAAALNGNSEAFETSSGTEPALELLSGAAALPLACNDYRKS